MQKPFLKPDEVEKVHLSLGGIYPSTERHYLVKVVTAEGAVAVSTPIPFYPSRT